MQIPPSKLALKDQSMVTLRSAMPGDARRLNAFRKALHRDSKHLNATAREATGSWLRTRAAISDTLLEPQMLDLLAMRGTAVLGELHLRGLNSARLRHDLRLAIGVLPQYQEQGIGSGLLKRAITWARGASGIERISLSVHAGNTAALDLYRKFGFVEEGRRKGAVLPQSDEPGQTRIDEILMALFL